MRFASSDELNQKRVAVSDRGPFGFRWIKHYSGREYVLQVLKYEDSHQFTIGEQNGPATIRCDVIRQRFENCRVAGRTLRIVTTLEDRIVLTCPVE